LKTRFWQGGAFVLSLLFWLAAGVAAAAEPVPITVVKAEFGIFEADQTGELAFMATSVVPHREGQRYGWIIELRGARRTVAVREEYLLPSAIPADDEAVRKGLLFPLPRRNQVSQRQLVPVFGRIYGEWAVGSQEPAGHRHLQVIVEGQLAGDFEFDVK